MSREVRTIEEAHVEQVREARQPLRDAAKHERLSAPLEALLRRHECGEADHVTEADATELEHYHPRALRSDQRL